MNVVLRWLCDHPGIIHGDLSSSNIMYRIIGNQVHGVLTDFDVSSWMVALATNPNEISQEVAGTAIHMAQELLRDKRTDRLYRHDLESLFYIMLLLCGRWGIQVKTGSEDTQNVVTEERDPPYQTWYKADENWNTLGCVKFSFICGMGRVEVSPSFEVFRPWLRHLQALLRRGFMRKRDHESWESWQTMEEWMVELLPDECKGEPAPYDDETLGGCIDHSIFIESTRHLTGELEGLAVRYDPSPYKPGQIPP